MNIIGDYIRNKIWDALNREDEARVVLGRSMNIVKCPKCGGVYSHSFFKELSEEETKTRSGGYVFGWEFECGCCPPMTFVVADHKGCSVYGQVVKGINW